MAKANITHREVIESVHRKDYAPVYLLMGDESYYIDKITECIADEVLTKDEQDFNLHVVYCTRETNVVDIINLSRRYPMMANHQVVIVKEAQNLLKIEELISYVKAPLKSTILVISYKNGSMDRRKKLVPAIESCGVVFESKKLKDGMLPSFIKDYLKQKNIGIDDQAAAVMAECVGSDLSRMAGELDKLMTSLKNGENRVTLEQIQQSVGISKEFNVWELRNAIVKKDVMKANQIMNFFNKNPKSNPHVLTVATLFNFFAQVMQAFYSPDKSDAGLMAHLEFRVPYQLYDIKTAMKNFTAMKTMRIIGKLRETDAKLKGIEKGNLEDEDIMRELLYFILH